MENLIVLVVLYKKNLSNSETLQSLISLDSNTKKSITELIIWDNSPILLSQEDKNSINDSFNNTIVTFRGDGKNNSLSYIYNTIIRNLSYKDGWLILLDHDTTISGAYFDAIIKTSKRPEISSNLMLPQIYYNDKLVSPAKQYYFIGNYFKNINPGLYKSKFITAINSGMVINIKYLKEHFPGYDEEIKFYGTDNDFMWKYSKTNTSLYILDQKINHVLNFYEDEDFDAVTRRFNDIKNGMIKLMHNINPLLVPFARFYWFYFSLKFKLLRRLRKNNSTIKR